MSLIQAMQEQDNLTTGWNGENGYKSTLNKNLDLHSKIGNMRFASENDILSLFKDAYLEDKILAMKNLFYIRDIKQGLGERRVFDVIVEHLAKRESEVFNSIVRAMPHYGAYKDLVKIAGNKNLKHLQVVKVLEVLQQQLFDDTANASEGETISLCAKWMPTARGNNNKVNALALKRYLFHTKQTPKKYRQQISELRGKLNLVETQLTEKRTDEIDYSKVPSQAFKKYTKAFFRNDEDRFEDFLNRVNEGEVKVNSGTLHAHQLVGEYLDGWYGISDYNKAIEAQWKNLPKLENPINTLAMVDVSGSMSGTPMEVAVSLGIYLSENTEGEFRNNFLTFSSNPELVTLPENASLYDKVRITRSSDWEMSTNLEKAFNLILDSAVKNDLPQNELPEVLFVLSDMQMNESDTFGDKNHNDTFFKKMQIKFEHYGYKLPFVVWWNISNSHNQALPVTKFTKNTAMISGFSQSLFNNILNLDLDDLENYTPEGVMLNTLNSERYELIEKLLKQ